MFDHILHILNGKASDDEITKVKKWLEENKDNYRIFNEISQTYYKLNYRQQWNKINPQKALETVTLKNRKNNLLKKQSYWLSGIAAALLLCIGSLLFFNRTEKQILLTVEQQQEIKTGEKKAILTLADGRKLQLNAGKINMQLGHVRAEEDPLGELVYRKIKDTLDIPVEYNTLTVPRAGEYILTLSDGTRVWLNSETELRYPVAFSKDSREVYIEGEAYFDVTPDPKRPFSVHTAMTRTIVYGTTFNVMAYREEEKTEITLLNGAVSVSSGKNKMKITPGQQIQVNNISGKMLQRKVDAAYYASWKNGIFDFDAMTLGELSLKLSRWYDVDFFFANPDAAEKRFTGAIKKNNSLRFILDFIQKTSEVTFIVKGKTVSVYNQ